MASAPQPANPMPPGMMQQTTDPLAALRDIHEPAMIAGWPPAPGWWVLAVIGVALLVSLVVWLLKRHAANRYRREALKELETLQASWQSARDNQVYLQDLQTLLKRVALTRFDREAVAGLTGEAWVQFLDRSGGSRSFSMGAAEVLIDGNYRPASELSDDIDVAALQTAARDWIKYHDPRHLTGEAAGT